MEDILASIRRILNDDETPAEASPAEDVFELDSSMIIDEPTPHEPIAGPTSLEAREPQPQPPPHAFEAHEQTPPHAFEPAHEEPLVAPSTAAAAGASMGALVRVLGQRHTQVYRDGPTLEDMVREEIRPMVKNWLDENLAPLVERLVRAEIERVTSRNL
jgi:cell pole-organizing protein PopZ